MKLNQNIVKKPLSIYVHYPFCKSKCPYCDFNSHTKKNISDAEFATAYFRELEYFANHLGARDVVSVFFGGGTPSLMAEDLVANVLNKIAQIWNIKDDCEITLEANPTSSEANKFKGFKAAGINRLSLGIQALNDVDLKFLGREHSADEALSTIKMASGIFDNYSIDLIYTRQNQKLFDWKNELQQAISLSPLHISLYQLTIEKGTKFYSEFNKGNFTLPDLEEAAQFYEMTAEITAEKGLRSYEISNYAQKNYESRHNLSYWQGIDYLGIGAGAHSRLYFSGETNRRAIQMFSDPISWFKKTSEPGIAIQQNVILSAGELLEELTLMALRLESGLTNQILQEHFHQNWQEIFDEKKLQKMVQHQLLLTTPNALIISPKGRLLTNEIIKKLLKNVIS